MNEIRYNQAATFGQVLIAGLFATQLLPSIPPRNSEESNARNVSRCIYRTSINAPSYSFFEGFASDGHGYSIEIPKFSWMTSDLADYFMRTPQISSNAIDRILVAIRESYGDVKIDAFLHTDPEEGWSKPVFSVHSGIEDFDQLMDVEDRFFAKAVNDSELLAVLPFVVVSQV